MEVVNLSKVDEVTLPGVARRRVKIRDINVEDGSK